MGAKSAALSRASGSLRPPTGRQALSQRHASEKYFHPMEACHSTAGPPGGRATGLPVTEMPHVKFHALRAVEDAVETGSLVSRAVRSTHCLAMSSGPLGTARTGSGLAPRVRMRHAARSVRAL